MVPQPAVPVPDRTVLVVASDERASSQSQQERQLLADRNKGSYYHPRGELVTLAKLALLGSLPQKIYLFRRVGNLATEGRKIREKSFNRIGAVNGVVVG